MSEQIERIMKKFKEIFIIRNEDVKNYLIKYYYELFNNQKVKKVERIDATRMIKTLGFRKNLSSWKNSYDNLVVSTCVKIKGEKKRYNYKFYFIEEKLSSELVEQIEDIMMDVNNLKERFEFSEAFKKIKSAEDLIKKKKDAHFDKVLKNLKSEVMKAEKDYKSALKEISIFENEFQKHELENDFKAALKKAEKIIHRARSIKNREKEKQYTKKNIELKQKYELDLLERIKNLEEQAEIFKNESRYRETLVCYEDLIDFLRKNEKNDLIDKYLKKIKEIQLEKEETEKIEELNSIKDQIAELEINIMLNYDAGNHGVVITQCNEIIDLFQKIEEIDLKDKYTELLKEVQQKVAEMTAREEEINLRKRRTEEALQKYEEMLSNREKEQKNLIKKAKEVEHMIEIQEDVIPLIEEFTINDILGDLSDDIQQQFEQLGSLLNEHRVNVKTNISNKGIIIRSSGEVIELEKDINANKIQNDEREVMYDVQIKLENYFDDVIEEAILTDLIPYNFEIVDIKANKGENEELPKKMLTNEGLEVIWNFKKIQPKEKIEIIYDLRHRISRTIIFLLKNQLKIIKTHLNIEDSIPRMEGFHEVNIPFNNPGPKQIKGLIVEDIIPLYYIHNIKEPKSYIPYINQSHQGDLIKWNVGEMNVNSINYHYKLLEIFKFEELKILIDNLDETAFNNLKNNDRVGSIEKYNEILGLLNQYFN
ncbi:MAG: hypothetical protein ACFFAT_14535 [Promethearchaeota archaeon]